MLTVLLALIHSRSTNPEFQPEGTYLITGIVDFVIAMVLINLVV